MRTLLSAAVLALTAGVLNAATIHVPADQPAIEWTGTYGGDLGDGAFRIIRTPDSGYMILGATQDSEQPAGFYKIRWNCTTTQGSLVACGVYLNLIGTGSFTRLKKMMILT